MEGDVLNNAEPSEKSNADIFEEHFPFYLSIGMSSAEYWTGDSKLALYYRKAYELKQEQDDYKAWLSGMYAYNALSVALANAFRKKGTPAEKYPSEPYLQKEKRERLEALDEDKPDKFQLWMESLVNNGKNKAYTQN